MIISSFKKKLKGNLVKYLILNTFFFVSFSLRGSFGLVFFVKFCGFFVFVCRRGVRGRCKVFRLFVAGCGEKAVRRRSRG